MKKYKDFSTTLFQGLKALAESSFPKKCGNCGRTFETAEEFLRETKQINQDITGLKESINDEHEKIVEAYRNCPCGSTLMDFFGDRRDNSAAGMRRRKRFNELLEFLVQYGLEKTEARTELLKVLLGEKSQVLAKIRPPINKKIKRPGYDTQDS
jgi:hypothetical protein